MKYIPIMELPVLVLLVLVRAAALRRHGIKVLVFGATDKSDFLIIPVVLFFFYALLASVFDFPFPQVLKRFLWEINFLIIPALVLCTFSLIWFVITLRIFGNSFRVGIDEKTADKLITCGTFSLSRNPIYTAFICFFTGMFLAYPGPVNLFFLILLSAAIHRQVLREEVFLKDHYGKEYEEYCKRTRRYL